LIFFCNASWLCPVREREREFVCVCV